MLTIFEFDNYKTYVAERIRSMPGGGHGEYKRIAHHLRVHTTLISHVFRGTADLTFEQAAELTSYLGLNELEQEYFLTLVQRARAGSAALSRILDRRLNELHTEATQSFQRPKPIKKLSERDKALFYSEWTFSGVRLLSAIPGFQDIDHIASRLNLSKTEVSRIVDFLVEVGLCEIRDGLRPSVKLTHVAKSSPLAGRHHKNWRLKAMERYAHMQDSELAFTMPVTLREADALKVRKSIQQFLRQTDAVFDESPPEKLYCLNVDWFEVY